MIRMNKLSESKELDELQNRKSELAKESLSLKDKQKNLEETVKVFEEKIAIQELKNSNKSTREAISQLESKIDGLEQRLKEVSLEPNAPKDESAELQIAGTEDTVEETEPEAEFTPEGSVEEEAITVAPPEQPMTIEQETYGDDKKAHDKKKRKFF